MEARVWRNALPEVLDTLQERVNERLLLHARAVEAVLPGNVAEDGVALPDAEVAVLVHGALPKGPGALAGFALRRGGALLFG